MLPQSVMYPTLLSILGGGIALSAHAGPLSPEDQSISLVFLVYQSEPTFVSRLFMDGVC